jgi:hypothetical protein
MKSNDRVIFNTWLVLPNTHIGIPTIFISSRDIFQTNRKQLSANLTSSTRWCHGSHIIDMDLDSVLFREFCISSGNILYVKYHHNFHCLIRVNMSWFLLVDWFLLLMFVVEYKQIFKQTSQFEIEKTNICWITESKW